MLAVLLFISNFYSISLYVVVVVVFNPHCVYMYKRRLRQRQVDRQGQTTVSISVGAERLTGARLKPSSRLTRQQVEVELWIITWTKYMNCFHISTFVWKSRGPLLSRLVSLVSFCSTDIKNKLQSRHEGHPWLSDWVCLAQLEPCWAAAVKPNCQGNKINPRKYFDWFPALVDQGLQKISCHTRPVKTALPWRGVEMFLWHDF